MKHWLVILCILGSNQLLQAKTPPPTFIQSALVLFVNNNNGSSTIIPLNEVNNATSSKCGGIFVTRQHVLTTSQCALKTKKLGLMPRRIFPTPSLRRGRASMSRDVITGKSLFFRRSKLILLVESITYLYTYLCTKIAQNCVVLILYRYYLVG